MITNNTDPIQKYKEDKKGQTLKEKYGEYKKEGFKAEVNLWSRGVFTHEKDLAKIYYYWPDSKGIGWDAEERVQRKSKPSLLGIHWAESETQRRKRAYQHAKNKVKQLVKEAQE